MPRGPWECRLSYGSDVDQRTGRDMVGRKYFRVDGVFVGVAIEKKLLECVPGRGQCLEASEGMDGKQPVGALRLCVSAALGHSC